MKKNTTNNVKLGALVTAGTIVLIIALYLIGSKQSFFSSTIKISAVFYNVNGLMPGNNVRYGGIDVGTVDKIVIENDTMITVKMVIEKKIKRFIKRNAIASIGTDGLMGNKLVNINSTSEPSAPINEGDILISLRPVETEEMVRTLNQTNNNLVVITTDLKNLTQRITTQSNLLNILNDTVTGDNIRVAMRQFKSAAERTNEVAININNIVLEIANGKGIMGTLINDTATATQIKKTMANLQQVSDTLSLASQQLNKFSENMNDTNGLVYTLLKDSVLPSELKSSLTNINQGTVTLNENLKAMQSNFLFRKYFREKGRGGNH